MKLFLFILLFVMSGICLSCQHIPLSCGTESGSAFCLDSGRLFLEKRIYDSASFYLSKALLTEDVRVKASAYRSLARLKEEEGDLSAALRCMEAYADLQDSPDEIPELFRMVKEEGYDLVSGWKKKRYDNALTKNLPSKIYNATARRVTGLKLHDMNCGLKAYRKDVVKSIEVYGEMHRYIPYLAKNAGFSKIGEKVVVHRKRQYGVSKFGLERFVNGYLDLFSLYFLNKFGKQPMHFFGLWGSVMMLVGLIAVIAVGVTKIVALSNGVKAPLVTDSPYFYIALTMMILGTQMFLSGFVGELVSRSNTERNNYHIAEEI